ncbi:glycosyltransferase family 39 protein [Sphingomonas sp. A2-49]|uniref:ArnT family glycosyltransferase n=1 Tax=Sphingomonas sp. A2-49 TaxID=1391375 RepID=UPI0021D06EEE|nr:glycosyltransferase family 39 protein [Sphingomonas sp. A2-49]MCU6452931.1 glycosyltransferase family 39 protein [Sphingomonas sp. A2-49]
MSMRATWLVLILAAVALRLPDIGNPLVDLDEQMYLLVGQRMWQGAIPYVDIWDRKPIGLFLIYAATQALPIDAIVAYQLAATAAAVATAGSIAACVRRLGRPAGALPAALLYLVWLELCGGRGGQSPVFYNALVAAAAWLTWRGRDGDRRSGLAAMLLVGLALQIKPTVVFEGAVFGIALLVASWRRRPAAARLFGDALLYASVACLPTLVACGVYAGMGHGDAWWFANVESIFLRRTTPRDPIAGHLFGSAIVLFVPVAIAAGGLAAATGDARRFLGGWLIVATIGWLLVPPYFNHYALPLLVPIAVAAGLALGRRPMRLLAAVTGAGLLLLSGYPHSGETVQDRRKLAALAAVIDRARAGGCPFVFQAPPALYTATRACLPTRYPFPPHLIQASEYRAIGVDPAREVARILRAAPPVIVTGRTPVDDNGRTPALVDRAIAAHYRPIARDLGVTVYGRTDR